MGSISGLLGDEAPLLPLNLFILPEELRKYWQQEVFRSIKIRLLNHFR